MKTNKVILAFVFLGLFLSLLPSFAIAQETDKVTLYFFWGDGCPHCAAEKPFLEQLEQKYPELEVKMFETWHNQENAKFFQQMAKAYGTTAMGVPTTFIGDFEPIVGFADYMKQDIEEKIKYCIEHGCINPASKLKEAR